jgi:hypothetical protein
MVQNKLKRNLGISSVCQCINVYFGEAHREECIWLKPSEEARKIAKKKNSLDSGMIIRDGAVTVKPEGKSRRCGQDMQWDRDMQWYFGLLLLSIGLFFND